MLLRTHQKRVNITTPEIEGILKRQLGLDVKRGWAQGVRAQNEGVETMSGKLVASRTIVSGSNGRQR